MRDTPRQLAYGLHLLGLAKLLLRLLQALLVTQPVRNIEHELVRRDDPALIVPQGPELHLVVTFIEVGIAELADQREGFPLQGAAPQRRHRLLLFGQVGNQRDGIVPPLRTHSVNSLDLVARRPIDRQKIEIGVNDLDEGIGRLNDVGEDASLGERGLDTALQMFVQFAQFGFALPQFVRHACPFCSRARALGDLADKGEFILRPLPRHRMIEVKKRNDTPMLGNWHVDDRLGADGLERAGPLGGSRVRCGVGEYDQLAPLQVLDI